MFEVILAERPTAFLIFGNIGKALGQDGSEQFLSKDAWCYGCSESELCCQGYSDLIMSRQRTLGSMDLAAQAGQKT